MQPRPTRMDSLAAASIPWVALVLFVAAAALVFAIAKWWPLQTDAGWYSYPGYALSEGRDPSENLLPT